MIFVINSESILMLYILRLRWEFPHSPDISDNTLEIWHSLLAHKLYIQLWRCTVKPCNCVWYAFCEKNIFFNYFKIYIYKINSIAILHWQNVLVLLKIFNVIVGFTVHVLIFAMIIIVICKDIWLKLVLYPSLQYDRYTNFFTAIVTHFRSS